jgi:hypothetical protein
VPWNKIEFSPFVKLTSKNKWGRSYTRAIKAMGCMRNNCMLCTERERDEHRPAVLLINKRARAGMNFRLVAWDGMGARVQLSTQMIRSSPIECYAAVALSAHDCTPNKKCVLASSVNFLRLKKKYFRAARHIPSDFFIYRAPNRARPAWDVFCGSFGECFAFLSEPAHTYTLDVSLGSFRLEL